MSVVALAQLRAEIRVGAWSPTGESPDAVFDDFKLYDTMLVP